MTAILGCDCHSYNAGTGVTPNAVLHDIPASAPIVWNGTDEAFEAIAKAIIQPENSTRTLASFGDELYVYEDEAEEMKINLNCRVRKEGDSSAILPVKKEK